MGCCSSRSNKESKTIGELTRKIARIESENKKLKEKCDDITTRYGLLLTGNCEGRLSDALRKLYNTV